MSAEPRRSWKRRSLAAVATVVASVALHGSAMVSVATAQELPDRAEEIRPLLIGAEIPSVEVRTLEDEVVDLQKVVLGKRTLLLFYRGGW